jgi:hypothetical protein
MDSECSMPIESFGAPVLFLYHFGHGFQYDIWVRFFNRRINFARRFQWCDHKGVAVKGVLINTDERIEDFLNLSSSVFLCIP